MEFESDTRMNLGRWFERIYSESDTGRSIATSVSGLIGLGAYLYSQDWVIGAVVLIVAFPIARIVASALHSRYVRSRQSSKSQDEMKELFDKLSREELSVLRAFVRHGGCVVAWGEIKWESLFTSTGIESLMSRGLVQSSVRADGMTETFEPNTDLFDYANTVFDDELPI